MPKPNKIKACIMEEERLHILVVTQVLDTTLKVRFHWHVIVRLICAQKTKTALECDLESGRKHLPGPARASRAT